MINNNSKKQFVDKQFCIDGDQTKVPSAVMSLKDSQIVIRFNDIGCEDDFHTEAKDFDLNSWMPYIMNSLSESERRIIDMYYYKNMTYDEISKSDLNISRSTISRRHNSALRKLMQIIGEVFCEATVLNIPKDKLN